MTGKEKDYEVTFGLTIPGNQRQVMITLNARAETRVEAIASAEVMMDGIIGSADVRAKETEKVHAKVIEA